MVLENNSIGCEEKYGKSLTQKVYIISIDIPLKKSEIVFFISDEDL